jgi:hypothetical protein
MLMGKTIISRKIYDDYERETPVQLSHYLPNITLD